MTVERDDSRLRGTLFMPCVLERLTDLNPENRTERFSRAVSVSGLRRSVLENVSMIFNSRSHADLGGAEGDPTIASSVLALGLPDYCGCATSDQRRESLRREVVRQLRTFEPRFLPESISVAFKGEESSDGGVLELEVRATIAVHPLKEELAFRALLNIETGQSSVTIKDA